MQPTLKGRELHVGMNSMRHRGQQRASCRLPVPDRFSASSSSSSFFNDFRVNNFTSLILMYPVFVPISNHQVDSPNWTCVV